jgi:hypothetical protein
VSTLILGFTKLSQLDENVKALELYHKWNKSLEGKIETTLGNSVPPAINYRVFAPVAQRRDVAVFGSQH